MNKLSGANEVRIRKGGVVVVETEEFRRAATNAYGICVRGKEVRYPCPIRMQCLILSLCGILGSQVRVLVEIGTANVAQDGARDRRPSERGNPFLAIPTNVALNPA